ncbi:MAG: GNAT family N-acetyltransferase, partial [bacterium]|nr:GNAT family N-acetyltransferase [bacterium]
DIWSGYYTDEEPGSTWLVEEAGQVLGYLAGCIDTHRAPGDQKAILRAMLRYALPLRPGTAGFFWRSSGDVLRDGFPAGELDDPRWPSHLHIDLLPPGRGRGAGKRLMEAWFSQLRDQGSPGCHLGTIGENHAAIRFFEAIGFRLHGEPVVIPGMRSPEGGRHHAQLMVIDLSGQAAF